MALGVVENENDVIYSPSCHNPSHTVWVKQLCFITKAVSTYCSLTFRNCMWRTNLGYRCNARKSGVRGGGRPSRAAGSVCVCVCVCVCTCVFGFWSRLSCLIFISALASLSLWSIPFLFCFSSVAFSTSFIIIYSFQHEYGKHEPTDNTAGLTFAGCVLVLILNFILPCDKSGTRTKSRSMESS